jgi:hypothetical protein
MSHVSVNHMETSYTKTERERERERERQRQKTETEISSFFVFLCHYVSLCNINVSFDLMKGMVFLKI